VPQLPVLPVQGLQPLVRIRSHADALGAVDLGLLRYSLRVWAVQPILSATDATGAQGDGYSPPCSCTIRTARARISGKICRRLACHAPPCSRVGASGKPGAVQRRQRLARLPMTKTHVLAVSGEELGIQLMVRTCRYKQLSEPFPIYHYKGPDRVRRAPK
jgi:hypothetical protein